ncbi:hypothetical protein OB69_01360 [Roseivirga seohaensis subsp. aquiponti]|uniref:Uncharacterized protein n=1 Tax=Roseivirga seohaensis subsp. aquiponti TaxID=1566026 RepID=A0A0L8AQF3_9BACT|nr:hypothetical protein [Roseivirga seohaensis]KOF04470.1 hypothetical protein OB69_01360 [Roseivirga seohaensis subsp. aquiponti]
MEKACLILDDMYFDFYNTLRSSLLVFDKIITTPSIQHRLTTQVWIVGKDRKPQVPNDHPYLSKKFSELISQNLIVSLDTIQISKNWLSKLNINIPQDNRRLFEDYENDPRLTRLLLSERFDISVINNSLEPIQNSNWRKSYLLGVTMNKLPKLQYDFDLNRLLDFKNDPDTKLKLFALRNWINDISKSECSKSELSDKFEYLWYQYMNHIDNYKLKYSLDGGEFLTTISEEILNNLGQLKLGSTIKTLLNFRKRQTLLHQEELETPGKEIAYIFKANQTFK